VSPNKIDGTQTSSTTWLPHLNGEWSELPNRMKHDRQQPVAVYVRDDKAVYVIGGTSLIVESRTCTIERLSLRDFTWTVTPWTLPPLDEKGDVEWYEHFSSVCHDGRHITIIAGVRGYPYTAPIDRCWILDVMNKDAKWVPLPSLEVPRFGVMSTVATHSTA
jgi:hypothetical protein